MISTKNSFRVSLFSLALSLGVTMVPGLTLRSQAQPLVGATGVTLPNSWVISQAFNPPDRGAPSSTAGGATRGSCDKNAKALVSLLPSSKLGLTVADRPTFFWYIPESSTQTADFLLMSGDDTQVVYQASIAIPKTPGIVSFTLPPGATPALEQGKTYHWYFSMLCNPDAPSGNISVDGWIERVAPTATLAKQLEKATAPDLPGLYANAGVWHEAIASIASQRRSNPGNAKVEANWQEMLKSVGLSQVASEPLVGAAQIKE